jgi:hypothetical protein
MFHVILVFLLSLVMHFSQFFLFFNLFPHLHAHACFLHALESNTFLACALEKLLKSVRTSPVPYTICNCFRQL